MPIKKSAKKTLRIEHTRTAQNDLTRAKIKGALKGAKIAITKGEKDADKKISAAYRELDIASKKNVIHKNKAARLKSRLAKKVSKSA
ncbi:MAG: 30S ribosomal protein S20 [Patescibacteria group bacterium]|jgi:small subunit ribosomal protein S20